METETIKVKQCSLCLKSYDFRWFKFDYLLHKSICQNCFKKRRKFNNSEENNSERNMITIDIDLIKHLKLLGMTTQAKEVLKAFRQSINQEKIQLEKELLYRDREVKVVMGFCRNVFCPNKKYKEHTLCLRCLGRKKNSRFSKREREIMAFFTTIF